LIEGLGTIHRDTTHPEFMVLSTVDQNKGNLLVGTLD